MDIRLERIADHYGRNSQILKLIEEMAELTQALLKGDEKHIAEEMADVSIMLEQVEYLCWNTNLVSAIREMKIERQIHRIEEER